MTGRPSITQLAVRPVRKLDFSSIRTQIIGFALLAALIPSLGTAWVAYSQTKRSLTEKISEELTSVSSQAAREIDLWLKERFYDARVFASSFEVRENMANRRAQTRLTDYLASVQERFRDQFEELIVVRPSAGVLATSRVEGPSAIPDAWINSRSVDPTIVDPAYWDESLQETVVPIAVPVADTDGRFLGSLIAKAKLDGARGILNGFAPGESGTLFLVERDGSLVVTSREATEDVMESGLSETARMDLLDGDAAAVPFTDHDGTASLGTARFVPSSPWIVVAAIPRAEAFARTRRLTNVMLLSTVGIIVVVGSIAYHLALLIVHPLARLRVGAAEVAKGDLAVELPVEHGGEVGYLTEVFNEMVRRLKVSREELERLSTTDGLTGLYNRRYMMDVMEQEVERSKRIGRGFTVVMLDVDHFKKFNDRYGHDIGDQVLRMVAGRMSRVGGGGKPFRYGGEEFAVVFPGKTTEEAFSSLDALRQDIKESGFTVRARTRPKTKAAKPKNSNGKRVSVTISIGVSERSEKNPTPEAVTKAADQALYRAKKGGRNRVAK